MSYTEITPNLKKAAAIAPAIRMLLKGNNTASIVTFKESTTANIELSIQGKEDMEEQYTVIEDSIKKYVEKTGNTPKIIEVSGVGIFAHGLTKKSADNALLCNLEIDTPSKNRLNEKISIVTGSAQGFGKGIAEEMLKEGANVVIADLNYDLALENANAFANIYGKGKTFAAKVDVGDEASVEAMVINTVLEFGGLDAFVNNAGIVKAGSLEEMDVKTLDFVTKINYTAYFLCAKFASRYMKIQNRFDKNYYMDIIQINSKSGLTGSNKNFAYAGSKFGGIGLTQSFALELVEYNIKVNSICPGNFFDGPLWSDPEKGLFVQYLKAGKVPGAKTVEDVKRSYESKVPMNRGCLVIDVARAIFYCIEQQYETGQAIPVTGGQVMLK